MPTVTYDPSTTEIAYRSSDAGKEVQGPLPCDGMQKGDLIRLNGNERKVRAVLVDSSTGFTQEVWAVKLKRSGYPSPVAHLTRHALKSASITERNVDLYSTALEARLQMAIDCYLKARREAHEKDACAAFEVRDEVTESDVVGVLI